jgi:hypothetical protein
MHARLSAHTRGRITYLHTRNVHIVYADNSNRPRAVDAAGATAQEDQLPCRS